MLDAFGKPGLEAVPIFIVGGARSGITLGPEALEKCLQGIGALPGGPLESFQLLPGGGGGESQLQLETFTRIYGRPMVSAGRQEQETEERSDGSQPVQSHAIPPSPLRAPSPLSASLNMYLWIS